MYQYIVQTLVQYVVYVCEERVHGRKLLFERQR